MYNKYVKRRGKEKKTNDKRNVTRDKIRIKAPIFSNIYNGNINGRFTLLIVCFNIENVLKIKKNKLFKKGAQKR